MKKSEEVKIGDGKSQTKIIVKIKSSGFNKNKVDDLNKPRKIFNK